VRQCLQVGANLTLRIYLLVVLFGMKLECVGLSVAALPLAAEALLQCTRVAATLLLGDSAESLLVPGRLVRVVAELEELNVLLQFDVRRRHQSGLQLQPLLLLRLAEPFVAALIVWHLR
jgi:hypothetical protein